MTGLKKLIAVSVLGVALSALAQVNLRPEVARSLQSAQEAIQAKQPELALQKIQEARGVAALSEPERLLLERLNLVAALNAQKLDLAAASLDYLLQSQALTQADRLTLTETASSVSFRNNDYPKATQWAKQYAQLGGANPRVHVLLLQSLSLQNMPKDVLQEVDKRRQRDASAPRQLEEAELRIEALSYKQLKDDAGYVRTLTELVKHYPSKDYWSDLLNTLGRLPGFSTRLQLDVSRLMVATDTMEGADDYADMAVFALKAGLPHEALRALDKATSPQHAKLKQQAQQRAQEDDKAMKNRTPDTEDAAQLAQMADVLLSKGQWEGAAQAYQKALLKSPLKREAEVRLHAGIALYYAKQKQAATTLWASVGMPSDDQVALLATLWRYWAQ